MSVVNSSAFTTAYSVSIPGGNLGTNRKIEFFLEGTYLNNSTSNKRLKVKIIYGSTTLIQTANSDTLASDNTSHHWRLNFTLQANAATNAQRGSGQLVLVFEANAPTTGIGGMESTPNLGTFAGTSTEDSTGDLTLDIQLAHNVGHVNLTWTCEYGSCHLA